ncbi:unnamed protein product [Tilletia controversa]|nr:unnamed protein product [Tilletia controversa]
MVVVKDGVLKGRKVLASWADSLDDRLDLRSSGTRQSGGLDRLACSADGEQHLVRVEVGVAMEQLDSNIDAGGVFLCHRSKALLDFAETTKTGNWSYASMTLGRLWKCEGQYESEIMAMVDS